MACHCPRLTAFLFAALGLLASPGMLQAGTTGRLEGNVHDSRTGEPLAGATILILETRQGAVSDLEGRFVIHNLRAGTYQVRISLLSYQTLLYREVTILPDLRSRLSVHLTAAPIEMGSLAVIAERPLIQTDITGTAYEKSQTQLQELPIGKFQEIVGLQPGATSDGHIRGGRSHEVLYLVDGLPVQDAVSGGLGMELPKSAISQVSIKTGGFDAEYGQALSGIVHAITRSGGDRPELQLRLARDNLFGGTQVSKYSEIELTAGGPLAARKASFFTAHTLSLSGTRWWQDLQYFFDLPAQKELYGIGKVDWFASGDTRLTAQLLYALKRNRDYAFSWRYNLDGLPLRRNENLRAALSWTHTLNPATFYTLSLSQGWLRTRIGEGPADSLRGDPYQYDFYLLYVIRGDRNWWADSRQNTTIAKAELTSQWRRAHLFKAGIEFRQYAIHSTLLKMEPRLSYFGKPLLDAEMLNFSSRFRYYPRAGALFIQDKYESAATRSVISAGLRLDFLDPRARRPAVELIPAGQNEFQEEIKGYVPAKTSWQISPRIGFAFPLTDRSFFFINWGRYLQFPLFEQLYAGLDNVTFARGVKVLRGNPELLAEKSSALEISSRVNLHENWVASALYFQKETTDQIDTKTFVSANSRIAGDYGFAEYVNNPYAVAHGLEFSLSREKGAWITGQFSYTWMEARGLSETEAQGLSYAQWGFSVAQTPYYLGWDQRHTVKADLRFALPLRLVVDLLWQYHTGRPYTYYPSPDGFAPADSGRTFVPNNRRLPAWQMTDLRVGRTFFLSSAGKTIRPALELYIDIRNLFNARNLLWMDASGRAGGELGDPGAWEIGRRTLAGFRATL